MLFNGNHNGSTPQSGHYTAFCRNNSAGYDIYFATIMVPRSGADTSLPSIATAEATSQPGKLLRVLLC
jgi:hypothetical protein